VRERAGAKAGGSDLSATKLPSRVVAVKDIPVFRKAALFAGCRRNEDLGRSVRCSGYPPGAVTAPMTTDVRRVPRRGTSSACATKRMRSTDAAIAASRSRTRPSLGPSTRARRSSLCTAAQASVVGRSTRHHGWANPRKWEKPALGSSERTERGSPRVILSREGEGVTRQEKEGDQGLRPCEDQGSGSGCPHIDGTLQKSVGDVWSQISSANALQKERSGSSERGPRSSQTSVGDTVGGCEGRNDVS
jgi:hypothetical protein